MSKNYNVDDILSEIKRRKSSERAGSDAASPPRPTRPVRPAAPEPVAEPPRPEPAAPAEPAPASKAAGDFDFDFKLDENAIAKQWEESAAPPPKERPRRGSLLSRAERTDRSEDTPEEPRANPLDYHGHIRPLTDRAKSRSKYEKLTQKREEEPSAPPFRRLQPDVETLPPGTPPTAAPAAKTPDIAVTQEHARIPRNLRNTFAGTGRELKLEDIRQMDFAALTQAGLADSIYDDEDDLGDGLPESSAIDRGEYNSIDDRRDVARDIAKTKLWLFIRTIVTGILTVILIYLALSGRYPSLPLPPVLFPEPDTMRNYMIACTALTGLVAVVGSATIGGGIANLFRMRANSDTLCSLAVLAALAQGISGIMNAATLDPEALNLYFPIAALSMLANAIAKLSMIGRIQMNFRVIASNTPKSAALPVESDQLCYELIRESSRRRPTIVHSVRAGFFTDFLALSFSDKYDVGVNRSVAPVCLLGAIAVATSTYFLTESMFDAISAFTAILCVCATLSTSFIETIPLSKLAKKLTPQGSMISGNKAVEDFCDTRAVILNERDLFPRGHVSLHGIKAFSRGRIDEGILDAASVICALGGSLEPLFLDMIGGKKKLLRKVDNIVYENGMGVSAWVDGRRVLIGNRQLMLNHSIPLPTDRYEQGLITAAGEPIYLSNSGEVTARFLVDYRIDESLAIELDALAARQKRLVVYTCDANITPHKIWEIYGYPEDLIDILPSESHALYREISTPRDTAVAELVYNGKASSLIAALLACINARASILSATVVQMVQMVLGYGLVSFMAFMGYIGQLSIYELGLYQLFWFVAIFIIQQTRQS